MKMIAIVVAALVVAACDRETKGRGSAAIAFSPTPTIGLHISPQTLSLAGITTTCAFGPVFTTGFDLVIAHSGRGTVFMDRVTLRLFDGSNVAGPLLMFPRSQLLTMFGSTQVVGTRAFPFRPQFGCGPGRPRSIVADVELDAQEGAQTLSVNAAFQ